MTYPRIYKPDSKALLLYGFFISFILFLAYTQLFPLSTFRIYQPHDGYKFWMGISLAAAVLVILFQLVIVIVGYKVTFMPDAIRVSTLLGTKTMQYSDISFYRYRRAGRFGAGPWLTVYVLYLVSRDPAQNVLDNSFHRGPRERTLAIPINFRPDQEFDDWVEAIPCELGQSPLPKGASLW
jgi:hypothetical protein